MESDKSNHHFLLVLLQLVGVLCGQIMSQQNGIPELDCNLNEEVSLKALYSLMLWHLEATPGNLGLAGWSHPTEQSFGDATNWKLDALFLVLSPRCVRE